MFEKPLWVYRKRFGFPASKIDEMGRARKRVAARRWVARMAPALTRVVSGIMDERRLKAWCCFIRDARSDNQDSLVNRAGLTIPAQQAGRSAWVAIADQPAPLGNPVVLWDGRYAYLGERYDDDRDGSPMYFIPGETTWSASMGWYLVGGTEKPRLEPTHWHPLPDPQDVTT